MSKGLEGFPKACAFGTGQFGPAQLGHRRYRTAAVFGGSGLKVAAEYGII